MLSTLKRKAPAATGARGHHLAGKKHSRKRPDPATVEARLEAIEAHNEAIEARLSALESERPSSGSDLLRRLVHHNDEIALEKEKVNLWRQPYVRDLKDLSGKTSLSEKEAADKLHVWDRTVRRYVKHGKLTKLSGNRIAVDQKFHQLYSDRHPPKQ